MKLIASDTAEALLNVLAFCCALNNAGDPRNCSWFVIAGPEFLLNENTLCSTSEVEIILLVTSTDADVTATFDGGVGSVALAGFSYTKLEVGERYSCESIISLNDLFSSFRIC